MQLIRHNAIPVEVIDKEDDGPYIMLDYLTPCVFGPADRADSHPEYLPSNWVFLPCS